MDESVFSADCITARLFEAALVLVDPRILVRAAERAMTEADWLASTDPAAMLAALMSHPAPIPASGRFPAGYRHGRHPAATDRKLRLFAVACCRHPDVWPRLTDDAPCGRCGGDGVLHPRVYCPDCNDSGDGETPGRVNRSRRAVLVAERFADGEATDLERQQAGAQAAIVTGDIAGAAWVCLSAAWVCLSVVDLPLLVSRMMGQPWFDGDLPPAAQADLIRCLWGNPFRLTTLCGVTEGITKPEDCYTPHCPNCAAIMLWNDRTVPRMAERIYAERDWAALPLLADALEDAGCGDAALLGHLRGPGPHARGCWPVDLILGKS